jgi:hypothetical protein
VPSPDCQGHVCEGPPGLHLTAGRLDPLPKVSQRVAVLPRAQVPLEGAVDGVVGAACWGGEWEIVQGRGRQRVSVCGFHDPAYPPWSFCSEFVAGERFETYWLLQAFFGNAVQGNIQNSLFSSNLIIKNLIL